MVSGEGSLMGGEESSDVTYQGVTWAYRWGVARNAKLLDPKKTPSNKHHNPEKSSGPESNTKTLVQN